MKIKTFKNPLSLGILVLTIASFTFTGCETDGMDGGGIPIGTIAGVLGGAAIGSTIGGGKTSTAAMLGGAALGGILGNQLIDKPAARRRAQRREAEKGMEFQRRLDYERQSQIQNYEVSRELEERRLFEQWKQQQGYAAKPAY